MLACKGLERGQPLADVLGLLRRVADVCGGGEGQQLLPGRLRDAVDAAHKLLLWGDGAQAGSLGQEEMCWNSRAAVCEGMGH